MFVFLEANGSLEGQVFAIGVKKKNGTPGRADKAHDLQKRFFQQIMFVKGCGHERAYLANLLKGVKLRFVFLFCFREESHDVPGLFLLCLWNLDTFGF